MLLQTFLLFHVLTSLGPIAHVSGIIDGNQVPGDEMLFMVSVQFNGRHACGGFLITEDFVVACANCKYSNPTHVVVGSHDLKKTPCQKIRIEKTFMPPGYVTPALGDDIMLLKLSKKARMNNKVATINLSPIRPNENEQCRVAGWGGTRTGGPAVDELMMADVSIISQADCFKILDYLPPNVICAGGYKTTKGFCQGDGGGPLVCDDEVVGIASYNWLNCNYPNYPNVYTDISAYRDWIDSVIKSETPYITCGSPLSHSYSDALSSDPPPSTSCAPGGTRP